MITLVFNSLTPELKSYILSNLKKTEDIHKLLFTSIAHFSFNKHIFLTYSTNNNKFAVAYCNSLRFASKSHISMIANKGTPVLNELIEKYKNIHENTIDDVKKIKLYNKGIIVYLQILNQPNTTQYLYGLAQLISYKSELLDIDCVHKYKIIEFELYKLYIFNYLLEKKSDCSELHVSIAINMIVQHCKNGIAPYVEKANPSQLMCYLFLQYYFSNTIGPNAYLLQNTLNQCINFMIKDDRSITSYNKNINDIDLHLYK